MFENTVAIWISPELKSAIESSLENQNFNTYFCSTAIDLVMIPSFVQVVDGQLCCEEDHDLSTLECILNNYSGELLQCRRCNYHKDCLINSEWQRKEHHIDYGPEYNPPVIMLNAEAKQRDLKGLLALIPPILSKHFDMGNWLLKTILHWHKKVLDWRIEYDKWNILEQIRRSQQNL